MRIAGLLNALSMALLLAASQAASAADKPKPAVVRKPSIGVHGKPDFGSPTVATLKRDQTVSVVGQQGLWLRLALPSGQSGFVRVNDVRMAYARAETGGVARALFTGKAGKGRVSETAGVRGLDESDLNAATFDAAQLARLESYRMSAEAAALAARGKGWATAPVAYPGEFQPRAGASFAQATQRQKRGGLSAARGFLSALGGIGGDMLGAADKVIPKSEQEITEEERALGPEIAGRILGAAPLWQDEAAQRRINLIGRWEASQTSRPDLPWTFGIIDSGEVNAFAAPGGYILVSRGLYQLLGEDGEVAAVLAHEMSHVVQRDHYEIIRKQELQGAGKDIAMSHVGGGGNLATSMARDYVAKHGAIVMMTSLDRGAEYRSDEAAAIYLARAGFNPLALYAVLQKMTALGAASAQLVQLYKTHPPLDERLDRIDRGGYKGLEQYTSRN